MVFKEYCLSATYFCDSIGLLFLKERKIFDVKIMSGISHILSS